MRLWADEMEDATMETVSLCVMLMAGCGRLSEKEVIPVVERS